MARPKNPNKVYNEPYFQQREEKAVIDYINTDDKDEKNKIFNDILKRPFQMMVESILFEYPIFHGNYEAKEVIENGLTHLIEKMVTYDPERIGKTGQKVKAYSYCGTIVRNYFRDWGRKAYKEINTNLCFDDYYTDDKEYEERQDLLSDDDLPSEKEDIRVEILAALDQKLKDIDRQDIEYNPNLDAYIIEFRQFLIDNDFTLNNWEIYISEKLQINHQKFSKIGRNLGFNNVIFRHLLKDKQENTDLRNNSNYEYHEINLSNAIILNYYWEKYKYQKFVIDEKHISNFPLQFCLYNQLIDSNAGLFINQKGIDFLNNKILIPQFIFVYKRSNEIQKVSQALISINEILYNKIKSNEREIIDYINIEKKEIKIKKNTKVQRKNINTGEIKIYKTPKIAALENNLKYRWIFKFIKSQEVYLNFVYSYYLKDDIVYNYASQVINKKPDRKMKKDENGKKYYYQVQRKNVLTNEIIIYETVKIAAEKNNIDINKLYRRLNIRSVVNDYEFSYVLENNQKKYLNNNEAKVYKISIDKMKIIEVYPNVMETARLNNLKYSTLNHRIEDQIIKDNILYSKLMPEEIILKDKMFQNHNIIKKIDIRTNKVLKEFHFLHEAAKDAGLKTINALNARIKKKTVINNILYTRD